MSEITREAVEWDDRFARPVNLDPFKIFKQDMTTDNCVGVSVPYADEEPAVIARSVESPPMLGVFEPLGSVATDNLVRVGRNDQNQNPNALGYII